MPYAYNQQEAVDPFSTAKLAVAGRLAQARSTPQPDLERPREALEAFPLDTMTMVGTMQKGG
ncbi:pilus assembly protein PilP, partial [Achromobacter sp. GbtcB20]|uniref:pilus assembly protein PilP n=1 Tax=Achromobacter sp. GbtcB20 TaxID=2824765 RepID=UPI001C303584